MRKLFHKISHKEDEHKERQANDDTTILSNKDSAASLGSPSPKASSVVPEVKSDSPAITSQYPESDDVGTSDLWQQAWKTVDSHLMADYIGYIDLVHKRNLSANAPKSVEDTVGQLVLERESKQWHLSLFGMDIKVREQAEKLLKFFVWSDDIVKSALSAQPYAALAWSGVQILLPLIAECTGQHAIMLDGYNEVCHLQMYWKVSEDVYFDEASGNVREENVPRLVQLYSAILTYQAKVVCHLSKPQRSRAKEDTKGTNDWRTWVSDIKSLDDRCKSLIDTAKEKVLQGNWKQQMHEMETQTDILDKVRQLIEESNQRMEKQYDDIRDRDLMRDLASDYGAGKDFNPRRVEGTCEWFFRNENFQQWRKSKESGVFWVAAGPGYGKSVLARALIDERKLSTGITTSTVCYFFFKHGDDNRIKAANALSAILHQLFCFDPTGQLIHYGREASKNFGKQLATNMSELWKILLQCAKSSDSREIVCVLDALDECDEASRKEFLEKMKSFYKEEGQQITSRLKFLITCRPYDNLKPHFTGLGSEESAGFLYLDDKDNSSNHISQDISLYIDYKIKELLADGLRETDCRAIADRLKNSEDRTYIYLRIIFDIIDERRSAYKKKQKVDKLLSDLPLKLSEAYEEILERCSDDEDAEAAFHILLAAQRPLTLEEMNVALTMARSTERFESHAKLADELWPKDFGTIIQNICGLFISVYDSKLYFIHYSAKEFLLDKEKKNQWQGRLDMDTSHQVLSDVCLSYLMLPELAGLSPWTGYPELLLLEYVSYYWGFHFDSLGPHISEKARKDARDLCRPGAEYRERWVWQAYADLDTTNELAVMPDVHLASWLGLRSTVSDMLKNENPYLGRYFGDEEIGDPRWHLIQSAYQLARNEEVRQLLKQAGWRTLAESS